MLQKRANRRVGARGGNRQPANAAPVVDYAALSDAMTQSMRELLAPLLQLVPVANRAPGVKVPQ
ncbi:unnamed protein product [Arabis nemorensis]|uniref:Uncharacterized protein n=1 Tax=Arabis nemorensis TaxID=586526 RepID=A0A565BAW7_9BRAS|nr:unnamed protein product [Arabis nemorensis]